MQITILRHGKPNFNWDVIVKGNEIINLQKAYNSAGIVDSPTEKSKNLADLHNFIVCSDLPRSVESAKAIGVKKIHLSAPLFREMNIPSFDNVSIKLPIKLWVVLLRGLWYLGLSKNTESISVAKNRARVATQKLVGLANEHDSVLLVGHGLLNYYIAKELLSKEWIGLSSSGKNYWEFGVYSK